MINLKKICWYCFLNCVSEYLLTMRTPAEKDIDCADVYTFVTNIFATNFEKLFWQMTIWTLTTDFEGFSVLIDWKEKIKRKKTLGLVYV